MAGPKPQTRRPKPKAKSSRDFNYDLDYRSLDLRASPELYRVGRGEQGVLMVEPYKSEILKHWKFRTPAEATRSAKAITKLFRFYKQQKDLVGMDMARKFLQMGYTRARRYANHKSGRKYSSEGALLDRVPDEIKARSAEIFYGFWQQAERDRVYAAMKRDWILRLG